MLGRTVDIFYDGNLCCLLPPSVRGGVGRYPKVEHVGGVQDGWSWVSSYGSEIYRLMGRLSVGSRFMVCGSEKQSVWLILDSRKYDGVSSGITWRAMLEAAEVYAGAPVSYPRELENELRIYTFRRSDLANDLVLVLPYYPAAIDNGAVVELCRSDGTVEALGLDPAAFSLGQTSAMLSTLDSVPSLSVFEKLSVTTKDTERVWRHTGVLSTERSLLFRGDALSHDLVLEAEKPIQVSLRSEGRVLAAPEPLFSAVCRLDMSLDGAPSIVECSLTGVGASGLAWPAPMLSVASASGGWVELGRLPFLSGVDSDGWVKLPSSGTRFPLLMMLSSEREGWKQVGVFREARRQTSAGSGSRMILSTLSFECLYGGVLAAGVTVEIPLQEGLAGPDLPAPDRFPSIKETALRAKEAQERFALPGLSSLPYIVNDRPILVERPPRAIPVREIPESEARKAEVTPDGRVEDLPVCQPGGRRKVSWDD